MDIRSISEQDPQYNMPLREAKPVVVRDTAEKKTKPKVSMPDIESTIRELSKLAKKFNRKLSYSINKDLNRVVVKIIDAESDKVIKELPPEEIQRLHLYLKDASGLFVNEQR